MPSSDGSRLRKPASLDEPVGDSVSGAPVEDVNPLGQEVTLLSAIMLNVGRMMGSAIFSVPGTVLASLGSVGLLLLYWCLVPLFPFAGLAVYSEYASMFPQRSGGEVVYLEKAYPRPRFLVSIAFSVTAILMSSSASNAIVFAQYFLTAFDIPITPYRQTSVALSVLVVTMSGVALSTKWSLRVVNVLSVIKLAALAFMALTGIAVLSGLTHIKDPFANFQDIFEGSTSSLNAYAVAFMKTNQALSGWANGFLVIGEVRSRNPANTVRKAGMIALSLVSCLYLLVNIAYVAAVPREDIRNSGQLVAALFFRNVFGPTRILPLLVGCSSFGNIIAVTVGQARIIREVARQGILPYSSFLSSTKPFGTPLGPIGLKGLLTAFLLLVIPSKDAFNFVLDLLAYPGFVFQAALALGIWVLRGRRKREGIPPPDIRAWNGFVTIFFSVSVLLLLLPWIPPEPGHGDVSFWYATYCVVGISIILASGIYYCIWFFLLPKFGGYSIVEEVETLPGGERKTRLVRQYLLASENAPLLRS